MVWQYHFPRPFSPKSDRPSEEPRREKEEAEEDHRPHPPPPPATPTTTPGDSHQPHPPRSATTTSLTLHFRRPPVAVKISWAQQRYHHRRRYPTTKNLLFVPLSFSVYWSYHFIAHASNASYQHRLQMGGVNIVENMLTDGWSKHQRSNSCGIAGGHGML
ncbi:hypothetical protein RHMOL_Rhmol10G0227300 [Rhododendron molle]|uniref:Uncharacterized protein n=1 Tax=Rhododendron molle TaxID=49168 RepID=A0ACC0M5E1_RHOML|nr:hypothetical protein RHMOL_Rhmol10G0227300 [Rhododendron molle]